MLLPWFPRVAYGSGFYRPRKPAFRCTSHNGTTYQHGEIFSAHELLPSHLPNQCVLCSCTVRTSTPLSCRPVVWAPGDCPSWSKGMRMNGLQGREHLWVGTSCSGLPRCSELPGHLTLTLAISVGWMHRQWDCDFHAPGICPFMSEACLKVRAGFLEGEAGACPLADRIGW